MTRKPSRTSGDLAAALATPSFTPGKGDAAALVELIVAGDERAAAALATLPNACDVIAARLDGALDHTAQAPIIDDGAKASLVHALGLVARAGDVAARARLLATTRSPEPRVRRAAIVAAGKLCAPSAELGDIPAHLLAAWDASDVSPEERRSLVEALGRLGVPDAIARLRALDPRGDAELARRRDRALLMSDREAKRAAESAIRTDLAPPAIAGVTTIPALGTPAAVAVRLHCKAGLSGLLVDEMRALSIEARASSDATVEIALDQPWSSLYAARLWTTAGILVPLVAGADLPTRITRSILAVRGLLAAWTRGPIRWRLQLASKQRAVVWRVARDVTAAAPELVNDPTATTWEIELDGERLELVPRRAPDPRFAYRVADVPAASHPTVAAALAWVAAPRAGERIWDPFCGSGLELVECARRAAATLIGTDLDDAALDAARANTAGLAVALARGDARTHDPGIIDAIVTNPPLGSRVQLDAAALLVACLPHFARCLVRGGRLVWITPAPKKTSPVAEALGFSRAFRTSVDLGGVHGQLERWVLG